VRNEIIHGLSQEKRWAHNKNARAEFLLGTLVVKHREHLRIVILVSKTVSYHDEDINIIWLKFRCDVTAKDDKSLQLPCGSDEFIDTPESGGYQLTLRRAVTEARYHLVKCSLIHPFRQVTTAIKCGKRHRLPYPQGQVFNRTHGTLLPSHTNAA
jgi:hypothetical protein